MYKRTYKMESFDPFSYKLPGEKRIEGLLLNIQCSGSYYKKIQQIQYASTDVMVASYPKTGTTILQEMVYLIRNCNDGEPESLRGKPNYIRVPYMEMNPTDDPDMLDKAFHSLPHPRTIKTHFPIEMMKEAVLTQRLRCIYVLRNPKDAVVSFYHFYRMNEFLGMFPGTWDDFFEMVMADRIVYGNIFDHYVSWWHHRHESNLLFVRYEDLISQPKKEITKLALFCGVRLADCDADEIVQATRFDNMKKNPCTNYTPLPPLHADVSPFMRKGTSGDWKNHFSAEQYRRFDAMMAQKLSDETELLAFLRE